MRILLASTLVLHTRRQGIHFTTCFARDCCSSSSTATALVFSLTTQHRMYLFPTKQKKKKTVYRQVMHQLCRADYVNVKFELIQLQGQVSRVPELSLASFPQLGTLLRTCPPVELTDPTADYG